MYRQQTNLKSSASKTERADETRKRLEMLFQKSFDPEALGGVNLDKRETARFIAEKVRVLRLAANAGGLQTLTWMIENTFYEAYGRAQSCKGEEVEFVTLPVNLQ